MKFQALVEVSEKVRATTKKKEKVSMMAELFGQAGNLEIFLSANFLAGNLPAGKLGMGWNLIRDAISDIQPSPAPVALNEVETALCRIATASGAGSVKTKKQLFRELCSRLTEQERRFLIGLIMGEIRQGALEGLVIEAIAKAASLPLGRVRQAFMFSGNVGEVARTALEEGVDGLRRFGPRLFRPVAPMLASPAEGETQALKRLGTAAWEYKIDGARVQIHKSGDEVRIFTRHLKEVTERLPEIIESTKSLPLKEAILDGEAIALSEADTIQTVWSIFEESRA